jgi:apolipoprotein N-acyltransferase
VLSFPRYGHPAVAFIALVPLLVALSGWSGHGNQLPGVSTRRGFVLGLIAGFIHYAGTVYWTGATVSTFGGIPPFVGVLVAGLLALYMAAYVAVFGALTAIFVRRFNVIGLCLAPAAWVSMEFLRGIAVGGFPWIPLGNTMVTLLPIAQLASIVGVYGLSIYVATLNIGVALAAISSGRRRTMAIGSTLLLIVAVSIWGGMRLRSNTLTNGAPIKVGLIQGNIAQTDKWNPARAGMILDRYLQLSRQAVDNGAQFLIWPESSTKIPLATSFAAWSASCGRRCCLAAMKSRLATRRSPTTRDSCSTTAARRPRCIEKSTWCRSANTSRSRACCFSSARWSKRFRPSRQGRA